MLFWKSLNSRNSRMACASVLVASVVIAASMISVGRRNVSALSVTQIH